MSESAVVPIPNKILALRIMGYTHRCLAGILGVSRVTVAAWEYGKRRPRPEHEKKIKELWDEEAFA